MFLEQCSWCLPGAHEHGAHRLPLMLEGQKFQGQSKIVFQHGRKDTGADTGCYLDEGSVTVTGFILSTKERWGSAGHQNRWHLRADTSSWQNWLYPDVHSTCSLLCFKEDSEQDMLDFWSKPTTAWWDPCSSVTTLWCCVTLERSRGGKAWPVQIQQENSLVVHEKADLWLLTCAERGRNPPCGYRERKWVNAGMRIALKQSLESQSSQGVLSVENPFALNKWFCSTAKGKHVVERLCFYLLGSYFDTLTERTMWLIGCYNQAQSKHILAQSNVTFKNLLGSKERK